MRSVFIVLAIWLAGLGAAAQFGKVSVSWDLLEARYAGQGAVALGLMVSVVGAVGLVFGTTAGLIVARLGPRRVMVAALATGAVVSGIEALLPSYPVMIALRVLEGVSHLGIVVVGPTAIAAVSAGRHQGLAMTLWSTFFGLTYAILAVITPSILTAGGIKALYLGHAVWMAGFALILFRLLPLDPPPPAIAERRGVLAEHVAIYSDPRIAAPALCFVFYAATYVAVLTLVPGMLPADLQLRVAAGMPLVSIAVSLTLGVWALRHVPAVMVAGVGYVLAAMAALAFWAGLGQGGLMAGAALVMMAALGLVQGASFASVPQLVPAMADRARASGAIAQMGNLGTTTGTPLLALMLSSLGPLAVPAFALPLCLGGLVMLLWLAARRRTQGNLA